MAGKFASIERVADASAALIRVEEPGFIETLALIVVGLRLPGMAGPAFVAELMARASDVPLLVILRAGETALEYPGQRVEFLHRSASAHELLSAAKGILTRSLPRVA